MQCSLVRLHGRNYDTSNIKGAKTASERFNYDYPDDELADIGARVERLAPETFTTHVIMNNNMEDQGQRNAATLMRIASGCFENARIQIARARLWAIGERKQWIGQMGWSNALHRSSWAPFVVILAGVCAALHIGKLPPAILALQHSLHISLLHAGFLVSVVQLAGMLGGVALGAFADGLGLRRSMVLGLAVLAVASGIGGLVDSAGWLLVMRALEGLGFLLVVLPAPGLVRGLVPPERRDLFLGVWGAYMPLGTAVALLIGPLWMETLGWRTWWLGLGAMALAMALWLARAVPDLGASPADASTHSSTPKSVPSRWTGRLHQTLSARGPWLVAMCFATYSSQWLAVIGFLPTIYLQAGLSGVATGVLTSLAAAANIVGNLSAARLLHRRVRPTNLLAIGFIAMGLGATVAFAEARGHANPAWLRYVAVLLFSMLGGLIPATLFSLAVRVAPNEKTLSSTVGWVQQWSALGQFAGPPLVAWLAGQVGSWYWTWTVTGMLSVAGFCLSIAIARAIGANHS